MQIPQAVNRSIKRVKIFTILQLSAWLNCSESTARRRLREWHAITSYNCNGRYYTLPAIAQFDEHALWHHKGACFSQHGNLKQTVVALITEARTGLSGVDLGALLSLKPRSFLSHFRDHPQLYREKLSGRFIWFAADCTVRDAQKQQRLDLDASNNQQLLPSDADAVTILVDLLSHPGASAKQIARRLEQRGLIIDHEVVLRLLTHHALLKKTLDSV